MFTVGKFGAADVSFAVDLLFRRCVLPKNKHAKVILVLLVIHSDMYHSEPFLSVLPLAKVSFGIVIFFIVDC